MFGYWQIQELGKLLLQHAVIAIHTTNYKILSLDISNAHIFYAKLRTKSENKK